MTIYMGSAGRLFREYTANAEEEEEEASGPARGRQGAAGAWARHVWTHVYVYMYIHTYI